MRKIVSMVLVVLSGAILAASCCGRAPARDFATKDLLIDLSAFPPGWSVTIPQGTALEKYGQMEGVDIQFNAQATSLVVAMHRVYRYQNVRDASTWYDRLLDIEFNDNSIVSLTPWTIPGQLPYQSPLAKMSRFACHDSNVGGQATVCEFMGQYEEYIVIFHTVMTPDDMSPQSYMTFADLEPILVAIDERMALHLERSKE